MKKFISLLMTIIMAFSLMTMTAFATSGSVTVSADKTTANVGDTVNFTFTLSGTDVWGFEFFYEVPAGLEVVDAYVNSGFDGVTGFTSTVLNKNINKVTTMGALFDGYTGTTTVAHLTCKVVEAGSYTVSVYGAGYVDEAGNFVEVAGGSATVSVKAPHKCAPTAVKEVEATCTTNGTKAHYACECGKLFADAAGKTEVKAADLVIKAAGHKFGDWTVTKEATCTEDGSKERVCKCGEKEPATIKATGHKFGEWTVTKEATCTEDGSKERVCKCGEKEPAVIKAEGHKFDWIVDKKATATEEGSKHEECSVCGEKGATAVIPATGEELDDVPQTNDITPYYMMMFVAMAAVCGAGVVIKRKNAR